MKYFVIVFLFIANTCKTANTSNLIGKLVDNSKEIQVVDCPKRGTCTVEVEKNKAILLKENGIGKIYPTLVDGKNVVFTYTFKEGNPEGYQDGGQSETLRFELNSETSEELVNGDLQKIKLLYGKHCYCKTIVGYYPINEGTFSIKKLKNGKTSLHIDFVEPKVGDSQFIKTITLEMN